MFDSDGSYIEDKITGEWMPLSDDGKFCTCSRCGHVVKAMRKFFKGRYDRSRKSTEGAQGLEPR